MTCPLGIQNPLLASAPLGLGSYAPNLQFLQPLGNQKLTTLNPVVFHRSLEPSTPIIQTVFDPLIGDPLKSSNRLQVPALGNGNRHQLHQQLALEEKTLKSDPDNISQPGKANGQPPLEEVSPAGEMIQTVQNAERLEHAAAFESPNNLNPIQPTTAESAFQRRQSDDSNTAITTTKPKQDSVIQPFIANPTHQESLPGANSVSLSNQLNNQSLIQAKELPDYPTTPTLDTGDSASIDAEGVDSTISQSMTGSNSLETTTSPDQLSETSVGSASADPVKSEEVASSDYIIQPDSSPTIHSESGFAARPSNLSNTDFPTPVQTTTSGSVISSLTEAVDAQDLDIDQPLIEETIAGKSLTETSATERTVPGGPIVEDMSSPQVLESLVDDSMPTLRENKTLSNISENNPQAHYGADINHSINPLASEPVSQQLDVSNGYEDLDELSTSSQSAQLSESLTVPEIPLAEENIYTEVNQYTQSMTPEQSHWHSLPRGNKERLPESTQDAQESSASVEPSTTQISVSTEDRIVSPGSTEAIQRKSLTEIAHEQAPETAKLQSASPLQELDELATDLQTPLVDNQSIQELPNQLTSPAPDKKVAQSPVKTQKNIAQQNASSLSPVSITEQAFRKTAPMSSDINPDINSTEIQHLPKGLESINILSLLGKTPLGQQTRNSLGNRRDSLISNTQELIKPFSSHAQRPQDLLTAPQTIPSASDMVSMEQTSQFYSPSTQSDVSAAIIHPPEINSLSAIRSSPEPQSSNWQRLTQPIAPVNSLPVKAPSHDMEQAAGSGNSISKPIPSYPSTPPYPDLNALQQFRELVQLPKNIHRSPDPASSITASNTPIKKVSDANAQEDLTASTADLEQLTNHIYQLIKHRLITAQERRGHYNRRLG